jgi:MFS transporter, FHS family, L-fucose permease
MSQPKTNLAAFITLVSIFFFWGFVAASNDILIPVFKKALDLSQSKVQLISVAFYISYTVGSLIYFGLSYIRKGDILNSIGYRNGMALGLLISALGSLMFIPAANNQSFTFLISGLFIVGLGFSMQQIAANPLIIRLGDRKTGSQRLSLAGGVNNIGTTIGPVIVAFAIFGAPKSDSTMDLANVQTPYLALGVAFILAAALIKWSSLPDTIIDDEPTTDKNESSNAAVVAKSSVFDYPQLTLGMIAIFVYVGVEVSTASNLPDFLKQKLGVAEDGVAPYVSLFWASLMIGRWTSAAGAFGLNATAQRILNIVLPFIAFAIFIGANTIAQHPVEQFYSYAALIVVLIGVDMLSGGKPAKQLLYFSFGAIAALLVGIFGSGMTSAYAFIAVGLFCSTLWPCIFTLAITGLGRHTNVGSSLLIMMIMGGGLVSYFQGYLSENVVGIQQSYWVGVVCFVYLAYYAWRTRHLDAAPAAGGH